MRKHYERWTVIGKPKLLADGNSGKRRSFVLCRCGCGTERMVRVKLLTCGTSRSCGCLRRDRTAAANREQKTTHGWSGTKTYQAWVNMHNRCRSKPDYVAKGIKVCRRWCGRNGFANFLADMGEAPDGLTLERINSAGAYRPSNCEWATVAKQNRNRRSTKMLTYAGRTQCLADWADELGISRSTLYARITAGWPIARALGITND